MTAVAVVNPNSPLTAALDYARRGFSVIPVASASKRPILAWEPFQTRRASEAEIRSWWQEWPSANVGLVCGAISGFIVLDADGSEGQASLHALLGTLPETPTARTGKGLHVLFRHPGFLVGNRAGILSGLDVRGDGGFIVAAPSLHENGSRYVWQTPLDAPLAPLPDAAVSALAASTPAPSSIKPGDPILNGGRNHTLYVLGRSLHARGLSPEAIHAALVAENAARCVPPLDVHELGIIIRQATQQPDRPDFTPPAPVPPGDPMAPIRALPNVAPLSQVADALKVAFAAIRAHVPGQLEREVLLHTMTELLTQKKIDRASRLVQVAAAESKAVETVEKMAETPAGGGTPMVFTDPEPWDEPVDGAAWLEDVMTLLRSYLVLPDHAAEAIALWVLQTYALETSDVAPLLAVLSPEKRCGKSRLLTLLLYLCHRSLPASNVTGSVVFRTIELWKPTLIVDEADAFINGDEALRGILNSGHTRSLAKVIRNVGDDHTPRTFSTWGLKALAKIGSLTGRWETVADRSIVVQMRRRAPHETVLRHFPKMSEDMTRLQRQAVRWVKDHAAELTALRLPDPDGLDDRAADNWSPLLRIAYVVGDGWPTKTLAAALALSGAGERETKSAGVLLLEDTRAFFETHPERDRVASEDLLAWLLTEESLAEHGWTTYRAGRPINAKGVGRLLEGFGLKPQRWREGGRAADIKVRGFLKTQFEDSWARYLTPPSPPDDPEGGGGATCESPDPFPFGSGPGPIRPQTPSEGNSSMKLAPKWGRIEGEKTRSQPGPKGSVSGPTGPQGGLEGFLDEPVDMLAVRRTLAKEQGR
jgi:hypothetical protein